MTSAQVGTHCAASRLRDSAIRAGLARFEFWSNEQAAKGARGVAAARTPKKMRAGAPATGKGGTGPRGPRERSGWIDGWSDGRKKKGVRAHIYAWRRSNSNSQQPHQTYRSGFDTEWISYIMTLNSFAVLDVRRTDVMEDIIIIMATKNSIYS